MRKLYFFSLFRCSNFCMCLCFCSLLMFCHVIIYVIFCYFVILNAFKLQIFKKIQKFLLKCALLSIFFFFFSCSSSSSLNPCRGLIECVFSIHVVVSPFSHQGLYDVVNAFKSYIYSPPFYFQAIIFIKTFSSI